MSVLAATLSYTAQDGWGKLPDGWRFVEATSVAVDSHDRVHVYNRGEHPVIVFERDGRFLGSWGKGQTVRAHGITIGPDDSVWLTDDAAHTIRQFSAHTKLPLTPAPPNTPSAPPPPHPFH